jgi:tripeptidyl-peptidase II
LDDSSIRLDHTPLIYVQSFNLDYFRTATDGVKEEAFRLNNSNEFKFMFKLQSNRIAQLTIAKNWSNIGQISATYEIKLCGLMPRNLNELACFSSQPLRIDVGSHLRDEDCEPILTWKYHVVPLKSVDNLIEIVKPSYSCFIKPVYQIVLTYNFHQAKTDEVCCEVPLLSNYLYENEYQSMFWMLFEASTKRLLLSGDSFPVHYKV